MTRPPLVRALGALVLAAAAAGVQAERADRDKPTQIEGAKCTADELKQVSTCTGNVVLTRGTLRITGERVEVRQDPEGYRVAIITSAPGQLATYRQRRDATRAGVEEWVEGQGERIEYTERDEVVRFIERAQWRRLEEGQPRDEVAGKLITYNGLSATYSVDGGTASGGDGRVRMILAPRDSGADGRPTGSRPPAPLKPAPNLNAPAPAAKK